MSSSILDTFQRPLRDLRISVIDRCNFRCTYCMPKEIFGDRYTFLPKSELLTFEEISRLVSIFTRLGVKKIRLTGGEPLLRKDLPKLIKQISDISGVEDIALTTNGLLLDQYGEDLYAAGLRRLNISLDALDANIFGTLNGRGVPPDRILQNILYANRLGFKVKVNMVVQKGVNEQEIVPMADYFKNHDITLRFIEFMDVGNDNGWSYDKVVTKQEILQQLQQNYTLTKVDQSYYGEVAQYFQYDQSKAQIGFITSVSESFCMTCTRARLSSEGKMFTCLFASDGFDLRAMLRGGATDDELLAAVTSIWLERKDRYSDERTEHTTKIRKKINMSYIGG